MKIRKRTFIDISATYFILWTFIPPMQVGTVYRVLAILSLAFWLLFSLTRQVVTRFSKYILLSFVSIIGCIILRYFVYRSLFTAINNTLQWIIILSVGFIIQYYIEYDSRYLFRLFNVILIVVPIFCVTTIRADLANPYASRIANSEWLSERFEANKNVGLYGFVFMCVFILPCLVYYLKVVKLKFAKKLLVLTNVVLIGGMIAVAGYSLAIACAVLGCGIVLFVDLKKPLRLYILMILTIAFLFAYRTILASILEFLLQLSKNNIVLQGKFTEFYLYLISGSQSGNLADRFKNYSNSVYSVLHYPFLGAYFWGQTGGGGHSFILDSIGKLGWIIGGLVLHLMLRVPFKISRFGKKTILELSIFVTWLLFLFADPICQELSVAIFVVFPIIQMITSEYGNAPQREVVK